MEFVALVTTSFLYKLNVNFVVIDCSVELVEQELWQREEKGLIGILPVRDAADTMAVGSMVTQGEFILHYDYVDSIFSL